MVIRKLRRRFRRRTNRIANTATRVKNDAVSAVIQAGTLAGLAKGYSMIRPKATMSFGELATFARKKRRVAKTGAAPLDKTLDRLNKTSVITKNLTGAYTGGLRNLAQAGRYRALTRGISLDRAKSVADTARKTRSFLGF